MATEVDPERLVFLRTRWERTPPSRPCTVTLEKANAYTCRFHAIAARTRTLLASITLGGMGETMAVEGSTNQEVFEAYVEHVLTPTLEAGQLVIMDNLSAHKPARVRELIESRSCELIYLPAYSPDFNPIEEAFAKIKGMVRQAAARTKDALVDVLGEALSALSARDAKGYFEHAGYRSQAQLL